MVNFSNFLFIQNVVDFNNETNIQALKFLVHTFSEGCKLTFCLSLKH